MKPGLVLRLRRVVQVLSLLLFLALLLGFATRGAFPHSPIPVDLYLRADPLVAISATLAARRWIATLVLPSVVILVLTVLMGRVYCGWLCPLGVTIDVWDRLIVRKGKPLARPRRADSRRLRNWKYYVLVAVLASSLFTVQLTYLLDPIALFTRTAAFLIFAPAVYLWNSTLDASQEFLYSRFDLDVSRLYATAFHFRQTGVVLLIIAAILGLTFYQERFWCRNLCPYGGLLALLSRFQLLKHSIAPTCSHCGHCELESRMGAYTSMRSKTVGESLHSPSECIQCFRCTEVCPVQDLRISPFPRSEAEAVLPKEELDLPRRRFIGAAATGMALALTVKANAGTVVGDKRRIRPPGALEEDDFLSTCIRCGECMRACPTNGLQPAITEAGLAGFWTPVLVSVLGPCMEKCVLCGEVCPTDALRRFTIKQKRYDMKLGLANVDQNLCIAFNGGRDCIVCAEVCSYSAVIFKDVYDEKLGRKKRVPTVDEKLCTGCGICENKCPVVPQRAIVVWAVGEKRLK